MRYFYFGFFRGGKDMYVFVSNVKVKIDDFKFDSTLGSKPGCKKINNPVIPYRTHSGDVYNFRTMKTWDIMKSDNDFIIVDISDTLYRVAGEDFLEEEEEDNDDYEVVEIDTIINEKSRPRTATFTSVRNAHIQNNVGEANRIASKYIKEKYDYPVMISGNNIPKIKLDKEFNYVGKINFEPFPKRDNGDVPE